MDLIAEKLNIFQTIILGQNLTQEKHKNIHKITRNLSNQILNFLFEINECSSFKGCGMGPWLALVSPCFRENVVATCKIGSFLCSLDNLLQKNVTVLFFGNHVSKWRSFEKRAIFDLLFTVFSHQGKVVFKKLFQHISHSHTFTYFAHPIDFFCLTNFEKKIQIYQIRFLFGMSPDVDSYSRHFGTINK